MFKRIFSTIFFSGISRSFSTGINLLLVLYISRNLSHVDLGNYGIFFFFMQLFSIVSSYGLYQFFAKEVAPKREDVFSLRILFKQFFSAFFWGFLSSAILLIPFIIFYHSLSRELLLISFFSGVLWGLELNLGGFFLGLEKMFLESFFQVVSFVLFVPVIFLFPGFFNLKRLILWRLVVFFIGILMRLLSLKVFTKRFRPTFRPAFWSEGQFFFYSSIIFFLLIQFDVFILSFYLTKKVLGGYFLAVRIFYAFTILAEVMGGSLNPFISRTFQGKEKKQFVDFFNRGFLIFSGIGLFLGIGLLILAIPVLTFFKAEMIGYSLYFLRILALLIPLRFAIGFIGTIMIATLYQSVRFFMVLGVAILFLLLNILLVPVLKAEGALWIRVGSDVLMCIGYIYFAFFYLKKKMARQQSTQD